MRGTEGGVAQHAQHAQRGQLRQRSTPPRRLHLQQLMNVQNVRCRVKESCFRAAAVLGNCSLRCTFCQNAESAAPSQQPHMHAGSHTPLLAR